MVNQQLVSYIKQQTAAGYDFTTLRNHLISQGYNQKDVDDAINNSTDSKLINYVQQQLQAGYDKTALKNYLISLGYQASEIDAAYSAMPRTTHPHHITMILTAAIVLISVSVGIFLFFFLTNATQSAPDVLLDYQSSAISSTILSGENLEFLVELESKGSSKRFDVFFTHTIYDENNKKIAQSKETVAVETDVSKRSSINIPKNLRSGTYTFKSIGIYRGETAESEFSFTVEGKEPAKVETPAKIPSIPKPQKAPVTTTPSELPKTTQPAPENVTIDITTDSTALDPPLKESIPTPKKTPDTFKDIEDDVKSLSSNPATLTQAESKCKALPIERHQDSCMLSIVEISKKKELCDKVLSAYRRDVCYINNFVVSGDYSVCDSIVDPDLQHSCTQLSKSAVIQPTVIKDDVVDENQTQPVTPTSNDTASQQPGAQPITPPDNPATPPTPDQPIIQPVPELTIDEILKLPKNEAKQKCSEITDKDNCFLQLSQQLTDKDSCSRIADKDVADQCYINYVTISFDGSVCSSIQNLKRKQECKILVG